MGKTDCLRVKILNYLNLSIDPLIVYLRNFKKDCNKTGMN